MKEPALRRLSDWVRCKRVELSSGLSLRRSGTEELLATRQRLIRVYAYALSGPTRMGVGPQLEAIERELRRRGTSVDTDEWMKHTRRAR